MTAEALLIGARVRLQYGGKPYGPEGLVVDLEPGVVAFRSSDGTITECTMPLGALYMEPPQ